MNINFVEGFIFLLLLSLVLASKLYVFHSLISGIHKRVSKPSSTSNPGSDENGKKKNGGLPSTNKILIQQYFGGHQLIWLFIYYAILITWLFALWKVFNLGVHNRHLSGEWILIYSQAFTLSGFFFSNSLLMVFEHRRHIITPRFFGTSTVKLVVLIIFEFIFTYLNTSGEMDYQVTNAFASIMVGVVPSIIPVIFQIYSGKTLIYQDPEQPLLVKGQDPLSQYRNYNVSEILKQFDIKGPQSILVKDFNIYNWILKDGNNVAEDRESISQWLDFQILNQWIGRENASILFLRNDNQIPLASSLLNDICNGNNQKLQRDLDTDYLGWGQVLSQNRDLQQSELSMALTNNTESLSNSEFFEKYTIPKSLKKYLYVFGAQKFIEIFSNFRKNDIKKYMQKLAMYSERQELFSPKSMAVVFGNGNGPGEYLGANLEKYMANPESLASNGGDAGNGNKVSEL